MTPAASALAALLLDAALRGTVLLLLAWGATALIRRAPAAARHLVWCAALAGVVVLPALGVVVPRWRVLPVPAPVLPAASPLLPSAQEHPAAHVPASTGGAVDAREAVPEPLPAAAPSPRAAVTAAADGAGLPDWRVMLLLAWAAGAGLLALRLGFGLARLWWLERRAVEITDDAWVRATDGLARRLRVGRIVTLLRGPGATVPMTWGLIRPVVLLPEEADAWDDERRAAVLAHELAHVRRWDALTQWVAHLATALFWFNPLVWMACRKLREEREHACDDAVLAMGTRPTRYADHLLDIVRALGTAEGPAAALAMARRSQFEGRLLAILDRATPRGGVTRGGVLATLCLTAACVVPLAALGAAPAVLPRAADAGTAREADLPAVDDRVGTAAPPASSSEPATAAGTPAPAVPTTSPAPPEPARESPEVAAARSLADDAARARYLVALVEQRPDSGVYAEIARAAERMGSPAAQRQVLSAVVTCPGVGRPGVLAAVEAVPSVRGSTDQRVVLGLVVYGGWLRDASVRRAFFRSLDTVAGSSDRRELLRLVLERGHTDPESLAGVITAAGGLDGSSDARSVLVPAAATGRVTGGLRELYLRAASSIRDESDRSVALAALADGADAARTGGRQVVGGGADRDGWTTQMVLADGKLTYDDPRDGRSWHLLMEAKNAEVHTNGSTVRVVPRRDGWAVLRETGPVTRSMTIRVDGSGRETRSFQVDGSARAYDAQAEAWTAAFLDRLHFHLNKGSRTSGKAAPSPQARASGAEVEGWDTDLSAEGKHDGQKSHSMTLHARDLHLRGTELVGILPGGRLRVEETLYPAFPDPDPLKPRPGATTTRRLEAQPAAGGGIRWSYRVDGVERPFGQEGRAWLARILRKYASSS